MVAATSPSFRRPASASSAGSIQSPRSPPSSNTHSVPSAFSTIPISSPHPRPPHPHPHPHPHPPTTHTHLPPPPSPSSSIKRRPGPSAQSSQPDLYSSSSRSLSSPNTQSSSFLSLQRPQFHPTKSSRVSAFTWKPTRFIVLHEHPHPPSALTSSLAPPSLIPMTAAGISVKSSPKSSRKSPTGMKLPMLPSAIVSTNSSGPTATPVFTFSNHHQQAYAHSLSAQQQLQLHQREIIHQATRAGIPQHLLAGPMSPRLIPLGSPGPVTPLTLEDGSDGFFASSHGFGHQQLGQQLSITASGQRGGL